MKNKKAQITLFLLVGLVLLIGSVFFIYLRSEKVGIPSRSEVAVSEIVPIEFDPAKVFVENCLTQTAMNGLKIIGENGGYIDPLAHGFAPDPDVTEGNAIRFASNWLIPYWRYLSTDNKCEETCELSVVPESKLFLYKNSGSPSIEEQLETYVDQNLQDCLVNFARLRLQGYKVNELSTPKTDVRIRDSDVQFVLDYDLEFSKLSKRRITRFISNVDVDLKNIYEFATLIINLEANYYFLERYVLDLLAAYSGLGRELPPFSDSTFEFGSFERWSKRSVYNHIKDNVLQYLQLLKVWGTRNHDLYNFPGDPYREAFYNGNMILPGNITFSNLAVDFDYYPSDPYFDLNCDGDECVPDSIGVEIMSLFGFQRYYFLYDLSFPTLVTIYDPESILFDEDKGYLFNFFLEANIRNNEPMTSDYVTIRAPQASGSSMLCDENKRNSGEITVKVKDSLTKEPIDDVQILYSCAGESCSLDKTQNGELTSKFPICFNGIVTLIKDDYISYSKVLTTREDKITTIDAELNPIITKKFRVKKALMEKIYGRFNPIQETLLNPVNLSDHDKVMITLKRKSGLNEMPFVTYAEFYGNQTVGEIKIAPGEYEMMIDLFYYGDYKIPPRTEEIEGETITIPPNAIVFNKTNPLPSGGLHCGDSESTKQAFKVTNPNFNATSAITFIALSSNLMAVPEEERRIEDLREIGKLEETAYTQYCQALQPRSVVR